MARAEVEHLIWTTAPGARSLGTLEDKPAYFPSFTILILESYSLKVLFRISWDAIGASFIVSCINLGLLDSPFPCDRGNFVTSQ